MFFVSSGQCVFGALTLLVWCFEMLFEVFRKQKKHSFCDIRKNNVFDVLLLGAVLDVLGRSWGVLEVFWCVLEASWGVGGEV